MSKIIKPRTTEQRGIAWDIAVLCDYEMKKTQDGNVKERGTAGFQSSIGRKSVGDFKKINLGKATRHKIVPELHAGNE